MPDTNAYTTGEFGEVVSPDEALEHALLSVRRAWASGIPDFSEWGRADVQSDPLVIDDLNGEGLFYDFNVRVQDGTIGVVRASANQVVGSPVVALQLGPHRWSVDASKHEASKLVRKRVARAEVEKTSLVCYCYPKIAVRVDLTTNEAGPSSQLIDVADQVPVEQFGSDQEEGFTAYSFLDEVAAPEGENRRRYWEKASQEMNALQARSRSIKETRGAKVDLDALKETLITRPIIDIIPPVSWNTVRYAPRCSRMEVFSLYAQKTNVYCAVATGQMILDFHKYHYDQDAIATAMGTGAGGTSNPGQVTGYESLSSNGLNATYDSSATWAEAKAEIDANRPLKSGVPGHARACAGWKRDNITMIGTPPRKWLKIFDPWPWNADICNGGAVYWENWASVDHTNFIYVRKS